MLINDEIKNYISSDNNKCKVILFTCTEDRIAFFDEAGCGCELIQ